MKKKMKNLKTQLLTYVHEQTGRLLNTTRQERKAERKQVRAERKETKLLEQLKHLRNGSQKPVTAE